MNKDQKNTHSDLDIKGPADFAQHFGVSRETLTRLSDYETLLRTWQKTINLVAPGTLPEIWQRHFADSAQLDVLAPKDAGVWLDLGSGAGFPGLVIAILRAGQGTTRVRLIESDARKAAFLREVARKLAITVDIVVARIETAANSSTLQRVDVVSARALARFPKLLELAAPFFAPGTLGLFMKGRELPVELAEARRKWAFQCVEQPSRTEPEATIAAITRLSKL
jgi:16S rRNA (guanine527-N7)-methyltransferase